MNLGTHRFQRAVVGKDLLIGIRRRRYGPPTDLPPKTARWKRCVPRASARALASN